MWTSVKMTVLSVLLSLIIGTVFVFTPELRGGSRFRAEFTAAAADPAKLGAHGGIERAYWRNSMNAYEPA